MRVYFDRLIEIQRGRRSARDLYLHMDKLARHYERARVRATMLEKPIYPMLMEAFLVNWYIRHLSNTAKMGAMQSVATGEAASNPQRRCKG